MSKNQKRILVAEDEKPLAHALRLKLEHEGFVVECVNNGEMALDKVYKEQYDLLVLDLVMPKMSGFEVLELLTNKKVKLPIVVLSNLCQEDDKKRVHECGAKNFFVKSDTPLTDIVEYIKSILK